MTVHNLTVSINDWCYSSLIDLPLTTPRVLTHAPREPRMLAELCNHTSALSSATSQLLGRGCKRHRARVGAYAFGTKHIFADRPISCAVAVIVALVMWIAGVDALDQVNDRFLPMNNISVSFAMLSSVEIVHELAD